MRTLSIISVIFFIFNTAQAGPKPSVKVSKTNDTQFGQLKQDQPVLTLAGVISNFQDHKGKMVTFEATPKKVCEKKGCWMVLKDGEYEVRTLFKDYGFFVPSDIVGKKVRVQGIMERKKVSAAKIRHFMKDEGQKMEEIKKVKTGQIKFQFVATGVEIKTS